MQRKRFFKLVILVVIALSAWSHNSYAQSSFENALRKKLDSLAAAKGPEILRAPFLPNNSIQGIMTPSGFGGNGSYLFGVIGGVYPALYTQRADLIAAAGFCFGDPSKTVNLAVSVNMTKVRTLKDLSLNMAISRRIFKGSSISVGGLQLFASPITSDAPGSTFYIAYSHAAQSMKAKSDGYSPLTYTIGFGNGRFLLKSPYDVAHGKGRYGTGVFANISYEIFKAVNLNAEWSGLNLGFSMGLRPFNGPISLGFGVSNLTKFSGDKPMGIISMGYPIALARRTSTKVVGENGESKTWPIKRGEYSTWSVGVYGGVLAPLVATGGTNDFSNWDVNLGYGLSLRKQLGHAFGIEGNIYRGHLSGTNEDVTGGIAYDRKDFDTEIGYAVDLRGVVNVATVDFLRRENSVNFFVSAGYGLIAFAPKVTNSVGTVIDLKGKVGANYVKKYIKAGYVPVGAGIKFKITDRVSFNLGYTMNFFDGDFLDGTYAKGQTKDKYSFATAGVEFSLGSNSKPNLNWANPLATMYDDLKDPSLRQELEALKNRVSNIEKSIDDMKKDSDGDGVADVFDKCPNTPSGIKVDGSGCPLPVTSTTATNTFTASSITTGWEPIQFEFNSSVLKTEAYPVLDKLSSMMRENGGSVMLKGYASSEGTDAYNMKLSKDRANSVKTYLVNAGVASSKVSSKGYGEANPIVSNDTENGRILNRRVEMSRM